MAGICIRELLFGGVLLYLNRSIHCGPHGLQGFNKGGGRQNGENWIGLRDTDRVESIGFSS